MLDRISKREGGRDRERERDSILPGSLTWLTSLCLMPPTRSYLTYMENKTQPILRANSMEFRKRNWPRTHLARKNIPKSRERVIKCFVVYGFIQVLNEDIPYARFPQRGVPLRPHDADGLAFDYIKVHGVQGSLSCSTKSKKEKGNFILKKANETPIGSSPLNTYSLFTWQI